MRYATKVTCNAHKSVMTKCKPGMYEYQCEANFLHYSYYVGGCRHVGYNNICCSGMKGAVLHYGHATEPNSKKILDGDMWYEFLLITSNNAIFQKIYRSFFFYIFISILLIIKSYFEKSQWADCFYTYNMSFDYI